MSISRSLKAVAGATAIAAMLAASGAVADGMPSGKKGSVKDAAPAADEGRKLAFSWNIGGTTDYVFRGISQTREKPAFQMGGDLTYGIFYAGVWGSHIDFGQGPDGVDVGGFAEIDWYLGIKPTWGKATFDFGLIYYTYPGARDKGFARLQDEEYDYVELKAGVSGEVANKLTLGLTGFYSPEYTNKQGNTLTVEGTAAYELPKIGKITPTVSALLGSTIGDATGSHPFVFANGKDSYLYWNVGLALAMDFATIDFRYWDTDIRDTNPTTGATNFCTGPRFQCDERFVFSTKLTF